MSQQQTRKGCLGIDNTVSGLFGRLKSRGLLPKGAPSDDSIWARWYSPKFGPIVEIHSGDPHGCSWTFSKKPAPSFAYELKCYAPFHLDLGPGPIYTFDGDEAQLDFTYVELCWDGLQVLIDGILERFPELKGDYEVVARAAKKVL